MNAQTKYILIALGVLGVGAGVFFFMRNKKKEREALLHQLAVGGLVFLIGGIIAVVTVGLVIKTFGG